MCQDRPTELIPKLRGVLTNPNCEFYSNFVAVHTLATWCKAPADGEQRDVEMGESVLPASLLPPAPCVHVHMLHVFELPPLLAPLLIPNERVLKAKRFKLSMRPRSAAATAAVAGLHSVPPAATSGQLLLP